MHVTERVELPHNGHFRSILDVFVPITWPICLWIDCNLLVDGMRFGNVTHPLELHISSTVIDPPEEQNENVRRRIWFLFLAAVFRSLWACRVMKKVNGNEAADLYVSAANVVSDVVDRNFVLWSIQWSDRGLTPSGYSHSAEENRLTRSVHSSVFRSVNKHLKFYLLNASVWNEERNSIGNTSVD